MPTTIFFKIVISEKILEAANTINSLKEVIQHLPPDGEIITVNLESILANTNLSLNEAANFVKMCMSIYKA